MEHTALLYFVGPAGAGKSTLVATLQEWMQHQRYDGVAINLDPGQEHNFQLVNPDQADPKSGKLPLSNPIAKALEGAKEGDEVKVGPNVFKILKLN